MSKTKSIKQIQPKQSQILTYFDNLSNTKVMLIAAAVFAVSAVMQCFICLQGTHIADEAFYLTIPYRILNGDRLFVDEWHVAQLSSFVQYPLVWLFVKIKGSTEGIILFSRHIFILINFTFTFFAFSKLKKYGTIPSLLSCLLVQISIPEICFSLDYYTISLICFESAIIILFSSNKLNSCKIIISGFLFALAVVGEPSLAVTYFIYTIIVIVLNIIKKSDHESLKIKFWGLFTAGIFIAGVLFLAFILSQETLTEFITSIPNIFRSGEYSSNTLFGYSNFFSNFVHIACIPLMLNLIWIISFIIFRKNPKGYRYCFALALIIFAVSVILIFAINKDNLYSYCYFQFYFAAFSFECWLLTKNKNKYYLPFFISSLIYFILIGIVSEVYNVVGTIGFTFVLLIFGPAVFDAIREIYSSKANLQKFMSISVPVIVVAFICCYTFISGYIYNNFLTDSTIVQIDEEKIKIDYGPYKGIKCLEEQKEIYDSINSDMKNLEELSNGNYTVASHNATWCSLNENHGLKTFTTWHGQSSIETYTYYFKEHGLPEYIYLPNKDFLTLSDSNDNEKDIAYFQSVLDTKTIDAECGTILKVNGWK